jgi:16S rRNA (guanine527-N7)-methyltransferase
VRSPTARWSFAASDSDVSRETSLEAFAELLEKWAPRLDLISTSDLPRFRERHIQDSLRALPLLDLVPQGPGIDVGSGAGLPGIPLAIAAPGREWRLLEPRRRRAAFLEEVVRELALPNCEVIARSAEEAAADPALAGRHPIALARALAKPKRAFELIAPLVAPGGLAAVFIGKHEELPPQADEAVPGLATLRKE